MYMCIYFSVAYRLYFPWFRKITNRGTSFTRGIRDALQVWVSKRRTTHIEDNCIVPHWPSIGYSTFDEGNMASRGNFSTPLW